MNSQTRLWTRFIIFVRSFGDVRSTDVSQLVLGACHTLKHATFPSGYHAREINRIKLLGVINFRKFLTICRLSIWTPSSSKNCYPRKTNALIWKSSPCEIKTLFWFVANVLSFVLLRLRELQYFCNFENFVFRFVPFQTILPPNGRLYSIEQQTTLTWKIVPW